MYLKNSYLHKHIRVARDRDGTQYYSSVDSITTEWGIISDIEQISELRKHAMIKNSKE